MIKTISQLRDRFLLRKYMKDEFESQGLRTYFRNRYLISVGMYSYGCFDPQRIAKNTKIGRYCSFARTSYIFNGNHGLDFISLHPYLYNTNLGLVAQETITRNRCTVEDDVWIGHGAIILPSVSVIGRGAVIGAGSVVTKDVPKYAIVCGNPAKIVRYRFSDEVINAIEETRWWELDKIELKRMLVSSKKMIFDPDNFFMKKVDPFS